MADTTIPALPAITSITEHAVLPIDSGTETFKITAGNLALFVAAEILPAGLMAPFSGTSVPSGWLLADGSAVSRTTYARLFAAIGGTYGTGDGSTTFNVPDMRGRVVAGKDDMGGSAAGRLTTAGSGVNGLSLGATGGSQTHTPAGSLSGTQNIDHQHGFAHTHIWMRNQGVIKFEWNTRGASDVSSTDIPAGGTTGFPMTTTANYEPNNVDGGLALRMHSSFNETTHYTTGVKSAPAGGDGADAQTTSMLSTNVVSGTNFAFTGAVASSTQPTLVTNYIIRV